ncbi:MAG: hypothetical protein ACI4PQ_04560 [Butyricicoccaceae bacterium]
MSHKLRVVCPISLILLVSLVFCFFSLNTKAASGNQDVENNVSVTYNASSWTNNGVAAAATAQETSAPADGAGVVSAPYQEDYTVPAQPHRDSGKKLTDEERVAIECIVMCEAGGEGEKGQMMVAQCILEGMLRYDFTIDEYIEWYKVMSTSYSNVTDEVRNSVSRVFDNGERVTESKADLWYNPAITPSSWHEEQQYVTTIGSHRFFWMLDSEPVTEEK